MATYKLSRAADDDLDRIFDFGIDQFGLAQALDFRDELNERFSSIAEQPLRWPAVDDIRVGYRRCVYKSHSIYYRITDDGVVISRILGRQDPDLSL